MHIECASYKQITFIDENGTSERRHSVDVLTGVEIKRLRGGGVFTVKGLPVTPPTPEVKQVFPDAAGMIDHHATTGLASGVHRVLSSNGLVCCGQLTVQKTSMILKGLIVEE
jgi:hypothetical protein